ncbi:MAG: BrnT family toxin [Acidobacteria bacterium]|nr:BrnT family toxin [Acidobacteriota bacterium]
MGPLSECEGFEWDEFNLSKNWVLHRVSNSEAEDVFFREPLLIYPDRKHSQQESRYFALGTTRAGRHLFVAFTIRRKFIRVISARDMTRKESVIYEHSEKANS